VNAGDAPQFVTLGEVLTAHRMAIMRFGGTEGVRDMGLLESAMAQPKAMFGDRYLHASIAEMGARICVPHREESSICGRQQANGMGDDAKLLVASRTIGRGVGRRRS
jgi:hypothetical protein